MRGSDLLSSVEFPPESGKCRACDITQIYPIEIYYYKVQGYDSQQVPALLGFDGRKVVVLAIPLGGRGSDWCITGIKFKNWRVTFLKVLYHLKILG